MNEATSTKIGRAVFALFLGGLLGGSAPRAETDGSQAAAPAAPRVIVRFQPGATEVERRQVRTASGASRVQLLPSVSAEVWSVEGDPHEEAAAIAGQPGVLYAEPDYIWQALRIPNDSRFAEQWALHNTGQTQGATDADIDAPEAWDLGTGRPIVLGVIDTGIDTAHADLAANLWRNPGEIPGNGTDDDGNGYVDDVFGWDFVEWDNAPFDLHGHGTHVAGIAAAVGHNGTGVAGVHWSAKVAALRFLNASGQGVTSAAILALDYASKMRMPITCNSWGGAPYSQALRDAIAAAADSGMLFVAAAGNTGKNNDVTPHYPASYDHDAVLAVAATSHKDRLAQELLWRSNYGARSVDLAAPGVDILSTWPAGQYRLLSGTSMAAPHVAGAAALLWSEHPELSALQVKSRLSATVDPLPDLQFTTASGGRLNIRAALEGAETSAPAAVTDLSPEQVEGTRVRLAFTAPGDDGNVGTARQYLVHYATSPLSVAPPESITVLRPEAPPGPAGTSEVLAITGLAYGTTYHVAIRAEDDWFNRSLWSNEASFTTLGPPEFGWSGSETQASLSSGTETTHFLTLYNTGPGEMFFDGRVEYPHERVSPAAAAAAQAEPLDLLLVYADHGAVGLASLLASFADVGTVDTWNAGTGVGSVPRYRDVRAYDVIVAWNNRAWSDPWEIGALLADCIDSGKAVVTLVDCWGTGPFVSLGRYFETPGYSPFISTGEALFEVRTLGDYVASHPVMKGVTELAIASYHNQVRLSEGARPVAFWNDGTPLVATSPHSVAINVWPGDGWHWLSDFPRLIHNAVRYAAGLDAWLEVSPWAGELKQGDSVTLQLALDGRRLLEGGHTGYVVLSTSDPDLPVAEHTVSLSVSGRARLSELPSLLEWRDTYLGYPDTVQLVLHNSGTAALYAHSFAFDVSHFTAPPDTVEVPAGGVDSIPLVFDAPAVGDIWSNLDFVTSDPERALVRVVLHAKAELPPSATLLDAATSAALYAGAVALDTVRLRNAGEGTLQFHTALRTASAAPARAGAGAFEAAATPDTVRTLVWARYADLSPGHEYESFQEALSQFSTPVSLHVTQSSDPQRLEDLLFDRTLLVVLEQENAMPDLLDIGAALAPVLSDFVMRGGTVLFLMEWGAGSGLAASTGLLDIRPVARGSQVKLRKTSPGHPLLLGLSDSLVGANLTAWYELSTVGAQAIVSDTSGRYAVVAESRLGAGRTWLFGFDFFTYNDDMARLLHNAVNLSRQNLGWLEVIPGQGEVESGEELELFVAYDAEFLDGGAYHAEIVIETNDPVSGRLGVPVQLDVTDGPHLPALLPVEFGIVYAGIERERVLTFRNRGNRILVIDSLGRAASDFVWPSEGFEVPPHSERELAVRFVSQVTGSHADVLHLYTNDPSKPRDSVALSAFVQVAPRLVVESETEETQAVEGGTAVSEFMLRNEGGSLLEVELTPGYDVPASAASAFVPLAPLPQARCQAGVVEVDGRVYVLGGFGPARNVMSTLYELSSATGAWEVRAPMPVGDFGMAVAADRQGRVYSFSANLSGSHRYEPQTNAWTRIADMPVGRVWGGAATLGLDGLIYVTGGEGDGPNDPLATLQVYHPDSDFWTVGPAMAEARYGHVALSGPDGRIYVMGGRTSFSGSPIASVEVYDPARGAWERAADMPRAVNQFAAGMGPDGRIYAAGGKTAYEQGQGPFSSEVWIFDPWVNAWSSGPSLPRALGELGMARSGSYLRIVGGTDTTVSTQQWGLRAPAWLGWETRRLNVAPGESLAVSLSVDARGLPPGPYAGHVGLESNDPALPRFDKPIALRVTEAPRLWLLDTARSFDTVPVGGRSSLEVSLANVGSAVLELSALSTSPAFPAPGPWSIGGVRAARIRVDCTPSAPGPLAGQIVFYTNDPASPVASFEVHATAVLPGALALDSTPIAFALAPGVDTSAVIVVRNDGEGPLHWHVTGADPPLVNPGTAPSRARIEAEASGDRNRRLTGVTVALTDANFVPNYDQVQHDLEARGASVVGLARPFTQAHLDSIDLLILDDYVGALFPDDLTRIRDWVSRGGRLLLQNGNTQGLPGASTLLTGTGLKLYAQSPARHVHSSFHGRASLWGADSIATPTTSLWCHAGAAAEVLARDANDRVVVAAVRLGAGRIVVTCSELLDNRFRNRADNRPFVGELLDWLAVGTPLVVQPAQGTLEPGRATEVLVSTAARPLVQGTYAEHITVHANYPSQGSADLRVTVGVQGQPELKLTLDTLAFDTAFVGYQETEALEVFNAGTAPLSCMVTSPQPGLFQVLDSSLTVPPLSSAFAQLRFAPASEGPSSGPLLIHTNDPDRPADSVWLQGYALYPPVLASQSASVDVSVPAGDRVESTIRILNDGASQLALTVMPVPEAETGGPRRTIWVRAEGASPAAVDSAFATSGRKVRHRAAASDFLHRGLLAGFFIWEDGDVAGFQYPLGRQQLWSSATMLAYRAGNVDHIKRMYLFNGEGMVADSLVQTRSDSERVELSYYAHSDDARLGLERKFFFENSRKYIAMETRLVNLGEIPLGQIVLKQYADWDLEGTAIDDSWDYDRLRQMPYGWDTHYAGIAALETPAAIDIDGRQDFARRLTVVDYDEGPVLGLDGWPILHMEMGDLAPGEAASVRTVLAMGDSLSDLQREVDRGLQRVTWLDANVRSVVVDPGASFLLTLSFDATTLFAGDYRARLLVGSNDPATPQLVWPVRLRVLGAPEAAADRDTADFGVVYMGFPRSLDVRVANDGTDSLHFNNVSSDRSEVDFSWTRVSLGPREDTLLRLTFVPRDTGKALGRLVLFHDDTLRGPLELAIDAQVNWPPELSVSADTLKLTLGSGTVAQRPFMIHNRGRGGLHWSFAPHAQITALPPFGQLPPSSYALVTLRASAVGLPAGTVYTAIELLHNDPARAAVAVPFALDVFTVRRGDTHTDNVLDMRDIVFLVNSIWKGGPDPVGDSGDLDCDKAVTLNDLMLLVNLILKGSPPPDCGE